MTRRFRLLALACAASVAALSPALAQKKTLRIAMTASAATVLKPHTKNLGDFEVRRLLPAFPVRMIGPFIFFDHMGPADFAPGRGIDVRPHPHVALATVTYLFEGEIVHCDSLGSAQPIRPGAVNWMLAGRGIELQVDTELNDHETIRLMVQQGVGASILPHSSVFRECAPGLAEAHRITAHGVLRTLALGVAATRSTSSAREAVAEIVRQVLSDIEAEGKLRPRFPDSDAIAVPSRPLVRRRVKLKA